MSTELRKQLENAIGTNEHIIAIILDIRGFTPFCKEEESLNVANFIKRVYIKIIDDYFPKASFYKPTGDGLLIIVPYASESVKYAVINTMTSCLNLVENFGKLREGDNMIYFATPDKVGIGISRGAACCISSGGTIIDYSGRVINLASRLNDFARPSGIVFDSKLGIALLPKEMQDLFLCENVYIRGIAEDKPMAIYFTKQLTIVPPSRKEPLKEPQWSTTTYEDSFKILKDSHSSGLGAYTMEVDKPLDEKQIRVEVKFMTERGLEVFFWDTNTKGVEYVNRGVKHLVRLNLSLMMEKLNKRGLKDDTIVKFEISYPVAQKNA